MTFEISGKDIVVVVGSRKSELALIQTNHVISELKKYFPKVTFRVETVSTVGDKILDQELSKIGEKSLFTKELDILLLNGSVDFVVHSLKDIPTLLPEGISLAAITEREDPRDVFVPSLRNAEKGLLSLESLPAGSSVGTCSVRRIANLSRKFPNLIFKPIRGNLNTRISKLDHLDSPYDGLVLAAAGLIRLGQRDRIGQYIATDICPYAIGQGALGIHAKTGDSFITDLLASIDHWETRMRCLAERSFLARLEGGCSVPIAITSDLVPKQSSASSPEWSLTLKGSVSSVDGLDFVSSSETMDIVASSPVNLVEDLGVRLANYLLENGAHKILKNIPR